MISSKKYDEILKAIVHIKSKKTVNSRKVTIEDLMNILIANLVIIKMKDLNHLENKRNLDLKKELSRDAHLLKVNNKLFQEVIKKDLEGVL